jgi:outer membrane protein assembly factor BamB
MAVAELNESTRRTTLRLWPGVSLVLFQWLLRFGLPVFAPEAGIFAVLGSLVCGLAIFVWWAFFSRAPRTERWGGILLIIAVMGATPLILDESIATGMMGMLFFLYAIPVVSLALVVWAVSTRGMSGGPRRGWLVAAVVLACGIWALLRTDGITGDGASQFAWRWSTTHEERLLTELVAKAKVAPPSPEISEPAAEPPPARTGGEPTVLPSIASTPVAAETASDWPGFRGQQRDGVVRGVRIATEWSTSPPVELWRRAVGPGWSSFAVDGGRVYTQEQRGEEEVVACYRLTTGEPVWTHRDAARFWESNAGAGPRGTPTLSNGRVYVLGATGILNALDSYTGSVVWSRNAATDTGTEIPGWGFASSPLVVDDMVIVATSGKLASYDANTGNPRWFGPSGGGSYSSPHLLTIDGVQQVVMLSGTGAASVAPADGKLLWQHEWRGTAMLQPAVTEDGDILITSGDASGGLGTKRLHVTHAGDGWTVEERWTSRGLKPYFNDLVVHKGHAFGFDGRILSCIDLQNGDRKWKGGRYGHGQLVLLPEQDLLLVLSEEGELALVKATPAQFVEVARFPAIEGKTWNHPVLVRNLLLVRNGQEMAAFRLASGGS